MDNIMLKSGRTTTTWVRLVMILAAVLALVPAAHVRAVDRALSGTVVDESGGVVVGARILVEAASGRAVGQAVSDAAGMFRVEGLGAGAFVVNVKMRLFQPARLEVTVPPDVDPPALRAILKLAGLTESVELEAALTRPTATAATRFEADALAVPQSTQSLTAALLEAQGAVDVADVLRHVPSAFAGHTRLAPFTSFSWRLRGLDAGVTRNAFRQLYFEDVDQSAFINVDRVEVIKGPGGAVYGKEGLGGVIHLVTKRPAREFAANAYATFGQYKTAAGGLDVTGPLGGSGLALRANGEIERSGSFVDYQDLDRGNAAISATWDKQKAVRAFVNFEYQRRDTLPHPGLPVVGTVQDNGAATVELGRYLGEPGFDYLRTWSPLVQAWLDVDLGRNWTLSPRYQRFTFNVNQQQMRLRAPLASEPTLIQRRGRYDFHERDKTQTFQLELKGRASVGPTSHQVVAGFEANRHSYIGDWFEYVGTPPIDALAPRYLSAPPGRADSPTTFSGDIDADEPYVQDLITWKRVDVLLGLRRSRISINSEFLGFLTPDQDHSGTAYQVGAAYRVAPNWSIFAGTSSGLSIDNIVGTTAADGTPFEPERSRQLELGVKHLSARVSGSAAYFDIRFENATTGDPANPDFSLQVAAQRSRGFELEGTLQAGSRWFVTAGFAYVDAEITESNDGDVGNRLPNVARVQVNAWGRFAPHPRVHLGLGFNVVGSRQGNLGNTYELPAYATVDASVSWQVSSALSLEAFGQNLLDQAHYTGNNNFTLYPGEPRSLRVRLRGSLSPR